MIGRIRMFPAGRSRPSSDDDARIRMEGYPGQGTVVSVGPTGPTDRERQEDDLVLDVSLVRSRMFRVEVRPWSLRPSWAGSNPAGRCRSRRITTSPAMSCSRSTWTSHPASAGLRVLGEVGGLGQDEPWALGVRWP